VELPRSVSELEEAYGGDPIEHPGVASDRRALRARARGALERLLTGETVK
jgi:hypothetical protein